MTKSTFVDSNSRRLKPPTMGASVSVHANASTVEIHHGRALALSFICHRTSEHFVLGRVAMMLPKTRKGNMRAITLPHSVSDGIEST